MYGYENIFGFDRSGVVGKARKTMREGWPAAFFAEGDRDDREKWLFASQDKRSHNYHLHCWDMLDPVLAAYDETGEEDFLAAALFVAEAWVSMFDNDRDYAAPVGEAHMAWYDMAVGLRSYRLAFIIDAAEQAGMLDEDRSSALWNALRRHADYLAEDDNIQFHNNHGFFQAAGQLAMGRRFADRSARMANARAQGARRFDHMLHQQFSDEGVHLEHSPDYHRMVYRSALAMKVEGLVEDARTIAFLDRIEKSLSWFVLPSGHIANIGDSDSHHLTQEVDAVHGRWQTDAMRFTVSEGQTGEPPEQEAILFKEAGYAAARIIPEDGSAADASYLLQQAAFHSRTHKHADTMGFIWSDKGTRILVDSGRYGYLGKTKPGSDLHNQGFWYENPYRRYCESTRAHNCLEFDGEDYPRRGVKPFGSAIGRMARDKQNRLVAFESEARHFHGIRHVRMLVLDPGKWLLCLDWYKDNLDRAHDVTQWFHLLPTIEVADHAAGFDAELPEDRGSMEVRSLLPVDDLVHERGQTKPRFQGWFSPANRKIEASSAIGFSVTGRETATMATLFQFGGGVEPDHGASSVSKDGRRAELTWSVAGQRHQLRFKRPAMGDIQLDYRND